MSTTTALQKTEQDFVTPLQEARQDTLTLIKNDEGQYLLQKLGTVPIFMSGGLGTFIEDHHNGTESTISLTASFTAPLDAPDVLAQGHRGFADAGADILTLDTFRGFQREGREKETLDAAFDIAEHNIGNAQAIAISLGPLTDTEKPDETPADTVLEEKHQKNIDLIRTKLNEVENKSETPIFLLAETIPTLREAQKIAILAQKSNIPFMVSFNVVADGKLRDGNNITQAIDTILEKNSCCLGISVNCCKIEDAKQAVLQMRDVIQKKPHLEGKKIGAYPNGFTYSFQENHKSGCHSHGERLSPNKLSAELNILIGHGANMVGGCCGAGPEHTRQYVEEITENTKVSINLKREKNFDETNENGKLIKPFFSLHIQQGSDSKNKNKKVEIRGECAEFLKPLFEEQVGSGTFDISEAKAIQRHASGSKIGWLKLYLPEICAAADAANKRAGINP